MCLFSVPLLEIRASGPAFQLLNGCSEEGRGGSEEDNKQWVPAYLPELADTKGQMSCTLETTLKKAITSWAPRSNVFSEFILILP